VDPLDGTKGFIQKTGDFAVMIGLLEHGRPVLGVVYVPIQDTLFFSTQENGTHMEKDGVTTQLHVSSCATELRFVSSVHHFSPQMQRLSEILNATRIPHGSIGVKAGMLCTNTGDFFASWGKFGAWDTCAPEALVCGAGGMVTDINGDPIFYGTEDHLVEHGIVYSNGACHSAVLSAIRSVEKEGLL
jgi:3'(2'), 5'-bisphosphate nucleotidase